MEILDQDRPPVLLSNYEVFTLIRDRQIGREQQYLDATASSSKAKAADTKDSKASKKRVKDAKDSKQKPSQQQKHAYHFPLPKNVATVELEVIISLFNLINALITVYMYIRCKTISVNRRDAEITRQNQFKSLWRQSKTFHWQRQNDFRS